jgi:hypothetical protein
VSRTALVPVERRQRAPTVLAAVSDADLGAASGVNDAASRIGGVLTTALVPALIGASGGRRLAGTLAHGYQPAMIIMAGLSGAAALIAGLFITDNRAPAPRLGQWAPHHGCAGPVPDPAATPRA